MPLNFLQVTLPILHVITGGQSRRAIANMAPGQCRIAETNSLICSTVVSSAAAEPVALVRRESISQMLSALGPRL
jgi:hypothetical protein